MDSSTINQWLGNGLSAGAIISTFAGWTPSIAAIVALIWYLIQIYESATVQRWLANRRVVKLARLKARVIMLEAIARRPALHGSTPEPDDSGMEMK